jgi:hypothetical protein
MSSSWFHNFQLEDGRQTDFDTTSYRFACESQQCTTVEATKSSVTMVRTRMSRFIVALSLVVLMQQSVVMAVRNLRISSIVTFTPN